MTSPFSDLDTAAISQHEIYESYCRAGFSKFEALELVKAFVTEQVRFHLWTNIMREGQQDGFSENRESEES